MTSILKVSEIQDPTNSNTALTVGSNGGVTINTTAIKDASGTNTALTIDSSGDVTFSGGVTFNSSNYDSGWITATLLNGYTSYDTTQYGPIRYRKIGNIVNIQGITSSTTNNSTIFQLPVGYRPPTQLILAVQNSNSLGRLDIQQDGDVIPISPPSSNWISCACTFIVA